MNWKDKRIAEINKINKGGNAPDTEYGNGSICYLR
jgi:hypothetical protein